jgi:hypothetical protein
VLLVLSALAGALFGSFMSSLPPSFDSGTFWIGNLAAPWALLAFGAGWAQRSRLWAAIGGVAAEVAIVAGFYVSALVDPVIDPWAHFAAPYPGLLTSAGTGLSDWLGCISPWAIPAIAVGAVYGLVGRWWGQSRPIAAGIALALPFFAEPIWWRVSEGYPIEGSLVLWVVEIAVGIALLAWVLVARRPLAGR